MANVTQDIMDSFKSCGATCKPKAADCSWPKQGVANNARRQQDLCSRHQGSKLHRGEGNSAIWFSRRVSATMNCLIAYCALFSLFSKPIEARGVARKLTDVPPSLQSAAAGIAQLVTVTPPSGDYEQATQSLTAALQPIFQADPINVPMTQPPGWLEIDGNRIHLNGGLFRGRGVNLDDSTLNGATCVGAPLDGSIPLSQAEATRALEVRRRGIVASEYGANYLRLVLDTRPLSDDGTIYYDQPELSRILTDPDYWQSVVYIVNAVTGPGLYLDITLFADPSQTQQCNVEPFNSPIDTGGTPTPESLQIWEKIVSTFATNPSVIFGLGNEPRNCVDTLSLQQITANFTQIINGIREFETQYGSPGQHLIKVPALQTEAGLCCSRDLSWWSSNPLSGSNIIYSAHWYEPYAQTIGEYTPFSQLPVIVDEIGTCEGMSISDYVNLLAYFESQRPPLSYAAWIFGNNQGCAIVQDNDPDTATFDAPNGCGLNMTLNLTQDFGVPVFYWYSGATEARDGIALLPDGFTLIPM